MPLPRYLDAMLAAWRRGTTTRAIHLGLWDRPPSASELGTAGAFAAAQARLDAAVLAAAAVEPGMRVLDVGCGLGSTLDMLNTTVSPLVLTGLNADPRQLEICAGIPARPGNALHWVHADACALPFGAASFDRVLCVEAIFHFASRERFLQEAARVLAPGGMLVITDLRAHPGTSEPATIDDVTRAQAVATGFGPWPEFWLARGPLAAAGRLATLRLDQHVDLSERSLPSHAFTTGGARALDPVAQACEALAWLHRQGRLSVVLERYARP